MPGIKKGYHESGQLSLDFIVGFTIFMIAFIFVITMMSGLFIGLFSRTVDYDAVAYRTAVILVEDPGEPRAYVGTSSWHLLDLSYQLNRDSIKRLGLSLERQSPGHLQSQKVEKFFAYAPLPGCSGNDVFCYPDDYRNKLLFGDYPYSFNISYRILGKTDQYSVGEIPPPKHGYIRRLVKVKEPGASMNVDLTNLGNEYIHVSMDFHELYNLTNPLYRIDPLNEKTTIYLRNFLIPNTAMVKTPFVIIFPTSGGEPTEVMAPANSPTIRVYSEPGVPCSSYSPGCIMSDQSYIEIEEGFFKRVGLDEYSYIKINLTFNQSIGGFSDYVFDYTTATIPPPSTAVIEVNVW